MYLKGWSLKRKAISGIMLALLSLSMLSLSLNIQPLKAAVGTIYTRADGSVDPTTAPIQRDGNIYTGVDEKSGPNQDMLGSDDIWDHPYVIAERNQDSYPLVNPITYEYLQILGPMDGFVVSDAFDITFTIINKGTEIIEFIRGDYTNRTCLEVEFESVGVTLWSSDVKGLTLAPGESFSKTVKREIGVYYGSLIIRLVHWKRYNGGYEIGSLGKVEVKGTVPPIVTEADIGFYGGNVLRVELSDYLKGLGYSVTYVNRSNLVSVKLVYLDYRHPPLQQELLDYVNSGGSLWISGEAGSAGINFLGATISEDSVAFSGSSDDPSRLWLRNHALTNEVSSIVYPAGAWLQISGNIEDIIRIDDRVILAIDQSRKGKILWLIDSDIFGGGWLHREDNDILMKNIVGWTLFKHTENQPPTCSVRPQKEGVEINENGVGEFFDIYVGGSSDDTGIIEVRFSSDDIQEGISTGEWTGWYGWDVSSGDWDASTKIKRWAFATGGDKEVWAQVKDDIGLTANGSANIYGSSPPPFARPVITSPLEITPVEDIYYVGDSLTAEFTIKNIGDLPITLDVLTVGGRLNGEIPAEGAPDFTHRSVTLQTSESYLYEGSLALTQPGDYHFFVAYYIENPTAEEKSLLDENNWNTCVQLGEGLIDADRVKDIIVYPVSEPQLRAPWVGIARITQGNNGATSHYDYGTWDNTYAIDVSLHVGSDVLAPADGTVIYVDSDSSGVGGKELAIEHTGPTGKKLVTVYLHLDNILVTEGSFVKQGQVVAKSGATGIVTGPHLHFHMWRPKGSEPEWDYDSHTMPIERLVMKQVGVDSDFREYDARKGELNDDTIAEKLFESNNIPLSLNKPPVADAGLDRFVSSGDLVTFNGSESYDLDGTIISYQWDFGDDTTAEGKIVSHRFRGAQNEPKNYTVTLTVEDDKGATASDTMTVTVYPLKRYIPVYSSLSEFLPTPTPPIIEVTVYYNWVNEIEGQDEYIISEVHLNSVDSLNFALYMFSIQDAGQQVWSKIHPGVGKEDVSFTYPFNVPWDCAKTIGNEHFKGLAVGPDSSLNFVVDGVELGLELRPSFFRISYTIELGPGEQTEVPSIHPEGKTAGILATVASPVEFRVYDSQGRVTGLVNSEVKEEIPNSMYSDESKTVVIFNPTDTYHYEVVGTDIGIYGLDITSVEDGNTTTFTATDIPTLPSTTQQYTIDWDALYLGEEGVTVKVDSVGDGVFELAFTSDSELTQDELIQQVPTAEAVPMWLIGLAVAAIAITIASAAIAVFWRKRK